MPIYDLRASRNLRGGGPRYAAAYESPLQTAREAAQLSLAVRKMGEPSATELRQREEAIGWVRYNLDSYFKMITNPNTSEASRNHMKELARDFASGLPPIMQEAVRPMLSYSPISEAAEKVDRFKRHVPEPLRPIVRPEDDPMAWAKYEFAHADWQGKLERVLGVSGSTPPEAISMAPGIWALRGGDGVIRLHNTDSEGLQKIADKHDTTPELMLQRGMKAPTGKPSQVKLDDGIHLVTPMHNYKTGKPDFSIIKVGDPPPPKPTPQKPVPPRSLPANLANLVLSLGKRMKMSEATTAPQKQAVNVHDIFNEEGPAGVQGYIENVLKPAYPGWKFAFVTGKKAGKVKIGKAIETDIKTAGFLTGWGLFGRDVYVENDDWAIVPYPSTGQVPFKDVDGNEDAYDIDESTGYIYAATGENLGHYSWVAQKFANGEMKWQ